jgi:DNA repair protein RecN (Recombination protein N)
MLSQLSIRNIVLIESCDITLSSGLCVLSGETGAGKSILLDALGLVLGARADTGLLRSGETQGSVTAEFDISDNDEAKKQLAALELEGSDTLIVRRTLASDGKTRCLVNDEPVTVAALKKLGETLVEVHGQHDQKLLQDASLHRNVLDGYGDLLVLRKAVASAYGAWREKRDEITALKAQIEQALREQDYLAHMRKELSQLGPQLGEEEQLASKRTRMMQSEKMFEVLREAIGELNAGKGVLTSLRSAQRTLTRSSLTAVAEQFNPIIEGLEKAIIETEEAQYALEKIGEDSTYDPAVLERIEERLFALKAAGRKYNMPVDELANLRDDVEEKLALINAQEQRLGALSRDEQATRIAFLQAAEKLSESRKKHARTLEKATEKELAPLKMEGTRFRVRIDTLDEGAWGAHGMDHVQFECATNVAKGAVDIAFSPLSKIASGGELSRFMLALKVVLSQTNSVSTLIFDEIDTGTGGAVADAIGKRLAALGEHAQVLVVTHLPQVAARGQQHLFIQKQEKNKKVTTDVKSLSPLEREEELARMLAGAIITPEARKAAQKLLEQAA